MSGIPVPVAPLYGALYLSSVLGTAFYGVVCMQTFFYYVHYPRDPSRLKILVVALWIVNTIHQGLVVSGTYKYIVAGLEDPASFLDAIPELVIQLLVTTPVALSTQGFFVYRIYIFSNKCPAAPLIWIPLAIYQLVAAVLLMTRTLYTVNGSVRAIPISVIAEESHIAISVSFCSVAAGVDVMIAACMSYLLFSKRVSVSFKSTAKLLERLIVFAINSGIWTAIFSLLAAIFMHVLSSNLVYTTFFIPLCSIYCNTLLANLNARKYLNEDRTTMHIDPDVLMSALSGSASGVRFSKSDIDPRSFASTDPRIRKAVEAAADSDAERRSEEGVRASAEVWVADV